MEDKLQKALIWIRNFAYIALFILFGYLFLPEQFAPIDEIFYLLIKTPPVGYEWYLRNEHPLERAGIAIAILVINSILIFIAHFILSKICYLALSAPKSKRFKDEKIYSQVLSEIESNDYRKGLLAKALSQASGNEEKSRAIYIKLRYQSIKDEGR